MRSRLRQSTAPVVGGAHIDGFTRYANGTAEYSHRSHGTIDANESTKPNTDDDTGAYAFADGNDRTSDTDAIANCNSNSERHAYYNSTPNGHMDSAPKPDADSNSRAC